MRRAWLILALVVASTAVGLMGIDLVLPAVPSLPAALGGDAPAAQLVLAAYAGGTCLGLLAFGSLSQSVSTRLLFGASLAGTALLSYACSLSPGIWTLVALRVLQGAIAAGPAVFAPGIVKRRVEVGWPADVVININFPQLPVDRIDQVEVTRQGFRDAHIRVAE